VFYEGIDMIGFEIITIELPLMARLYSDEKQPTELILTGIIELLLKDAKGHLIAVDLIIFDFRQQLMMTLSYISYSRTVPEASSQWKRAIPPKTPNCFFRTETDGFISITIPVSKDYTCRLRKNRLTVSATELKS
jgi:hypothetical protein